MATKGLKAYFCLAVIGLAGISSAQATLLTFDDLGLNNFDPITTQYASAGVTFQGVTDGGALVSVDVYDGSSAGGDFPVSPPLELSNFYGQSFGNRAHITEFIFGSSASGISFYYNPQGYLGANTAFNVYNTSHSLVDTFTVPTAIGDAWVFVTVPDSNVGEIDMVNPRPGWALLIDNLSFTAPPVPEPSVATISSFLAACFAVRSAVRRKLTCNVHHTGRFGLDHPDYLITIHKPRVRRFLSYMDCTIQLTL